MRQKARSAAVVLGIDDRIRTLIVEARLLGERALRVAGWCPGAGDAILVTGSGRSGTTWLTDMLCMGGGLQPVFEPLHPAAVPEVRKLLGWDESLHPHIRSHYLRPGALEAKWNDFLERALTGRVRNYWTDYDRASFFPKRYVVKVIRANLMLGQICDNFRPTVVHVVRHPCATVASRLQVGWHADVADILCQADLVRDHLASVEREVREETDLLGAHAVWWAVENAVAVRQLKGYRHKLLFYEDLAADPIPGFRDVREFCGLEHVGLAEDKVVAPSRMAAADGPHDGRDERLLTWKRVLGLEERKRILDWAHRLGIEWYADDSAYPVRRQE